MILPCHDMVLIRYITAAELICLVAASLQVRLSSCLHPTNPQPLHKPSQEPKRAFTHDQQVVRIHVQWAQVIYAAELLPPPRASVFIPSPTRVMSHALPGQQLCLAAGCQDDSDCGPVCSHLPSQPCTWQSVSSGPMCTPTRPRVSSLLSTQSTY